MKIANLKESRILIVDDQTEIWKHWPRFWMFSGYVNIHCLNDSRQTLQIFQEFRPDLILLDLHMPHVDGLAALDQLATVIPVDDYTPVLVLTGDSTSEAKEKALSHGAHDFLAKPLNRIEVRLRVKNLLETRQLHLQLKAQNASLEQQVQERTKLAEELGLSNQKLRETQTHLIHSEKMAGLGQLVAGIAHEINNPLAFVINNMFLVVRRWLPGWRHRTRNCRRERQRRLTKSWHGPTTRMRVPRGSRNWFPAENLFPTRRGNSQDNRYP